MIVFREGNLRITFPDGMTVEKFDDRANHGLSHCMKAVDFIVDVPDEYIAFMELKNPDDPNAQEMEKERFIKKFSEGKLDHDLYYKYRDTFLYQWARERLDRRPIKYWVIIALDSLTSPELINRTDELKSKIPLMGPKSGNWSRQIVNDCTVYNIKTWRRYHRDILLQQI